MNKSKKYTVTNLSRTHQPVRVVSPKRGDQKFETLKPGEKKELELANAESASIRGRCHAGLLKIEEVGSIAPTAVEKPRGS